MQFAHRLDSPLHTALKLWEVASGSQGKLKTRHPGSGQFSQGFGIRKGRPGHRVYKAFCYAQNT